MRILIYGINYAPELTGIGKYTGEMGAWLAEKGHTVEVITALPYYPEWNVHPAYKGRKWYTETIDNVTVHRCPLYVPRKLNSLKRILHEFSFLASTLPVWVAKLFQKKYDVIICISPPFYLGFLPWIYSMIRRSKLFIHIQDLQVDAAKDLGMIKNRFFLRLMFGGEKFILKRSAAVSTISAGMVRKIEAKGIPASGIILFTNWVDINTIRPLSKTQSLRHEWGLAQSDKVVLYAGNLGEKQGLESLIAISRSFSHRKDVYFVIVGSGSNKENLQCLAREANLTNTLFFPLQPLAKLPALLASADIHLVLQKSTAADLVMPSKLTGILAAGGCPIVTALPGTSLHELITRYEAGIVVEPGNDEALTAAIALALESDLDGYRRNARKYAEQYLSKEKIMERWESQLLNKITAGFSPIPIPYK